MKKHLFKIIIFIALGMLLGEIVVRIFDLTVDVPKFYKDSDELIKFYPDQSGNSVQGCKWIINKYGNFGPEPRSMDSLVTVIGNSYISNTMNPPECHQAYYLTNLSENYNFYPISRDGIGFLEFMELAKSVEQLNPVKHLLYVSDHDFVTSIVELEYNPYSVQLSLQDGKIKHAQLTSNNFKDILYFFKFPYFLYRNFFVLAEMDLLEGGEREIEPEGPVNEIDYKSLQVLLDFVKEKYDISKTLLVFFPNSDPELISMTVKTGYEIIQLETDDYVSWLTSAAGHWSCHGHEIVAGQIVNYLEKAKINKE